VPRKVNKNPHAPESTYNLSDSTSGATVFSQLIQPISQCLLSMNHRHNFRFSGWRACQSMRFKWLLWVDSVEKVCHGLRIRKIRVRDWNLYFWQSLPDSDFT